MYPEKSSLLDSIFVDLIDRLVFRFLVLESDYDTRSFVLELSHLLFEIVKNADLTLCNRIKFLFWSVGCIQDYAFSSLRFTK